MGQSAPLSPPDCPSDALHASDAQSLLGFLEVGGWVREERVSICSTRM